MLSSTCVTVYFLQARYCKVRQTITKHANIGLCLKIKQHIGFTYLFETFFTERTLLVVVQTAFQTGLTESVTTGSRDGLIEQP